MRQRRAQPIRASRSSPRAGPAPRYAGYFLVGPTAVGKSAVAQLIAEQEGWDILSADSMSVYRGMDIGTAKPGPAESKRVRYWGLDLADPADAFSVGQYLEYARRAFEQCGREKRPLMVVGGSGLYIKCLTEGLARVPPADPDFRARAETLFKEGGLQALQRVVRAMDSQRYRALGDGAKNRRRLVRAMELAAHSVPVTRTWSAKPSIPVVGLRMETMALHKKVDARVRHMYEAGLVDEVKKLIGNHSRLSKTALQAIGYAEAFAVLRGDIHLEDAIRRTAARTRQLAKRQMTWFRHQARVEWIAAEQDSAADVLGKKVLELWRRYGPTPVVF